MQCMSPEQGIMKNHLICVVLVCSLIEEVFSQYVRNVPGYTVEEYEDEMRTQDTDIHRPCAVTDVLCIRNYLAAHSHCKIATGPVPSPLYTQQQNLYAPTFNFSVALTMLYSNGMNGSVSEFYVNRNSKLTVLAIDYGEILQKGIAYIRFYGKATEPLVTKTFAEITEPSTVTTTVFRGVDHLSLANSETHTSFPAEPALRFTEGSDPVGVALMAARMAARSVTELFTETRLASGTHFAATVIQFSICDFGLNID